MIVLAVVGGIAALIAFEVFTDRKVRRSAAGATPVVIVRGLRPRWWRRLLGKALGFALSVAAFTGLGLLVLHLLRTASDSSDSDHSWPMPGASAPHHASSTSPTSPTSARGH